MPAPLFLAFIIGAATPPLEPPPADTGEAVVAASTAGDERWIDRTGVRRSSDTTRRRRAVDISPWYERRLLAHRVTAVAVPALFAWQYYQGRRLLDDEAEARAAHRAGRTAIVAAFGINAVTGAWNLWESRGAPGGGARTAHGLSMIGAAAGFAIAGTRLVDDMRTAGTREALVDARHRHRNLALGSMAVTLVSGTAMWLANR